MKKQYIALFAATLSFSATAKAGSFSEVQLRFRVGIEKCVTGHSLGCVVLLEEEREATVVFNQSGPFQCGQVSLDGGDPNRNMCGSFQASLDYGNVGFRFPGILLFNYYDAKPMYSPNALFVSGRFLTFPPNHAPWQKRYVLERLPNTTDAEFRFDGASAPVEGDASREYVPYVKIVSRRVLPQR